MRSNRTGTPQLFGGGNWALTVCLWLGGGLFALAQGDKPVEATVQVDVLVYGGTPAGVAAAVEAGKLGRSVMIIEPTRRVGGLMTNGLSHVDFRTFEAMTGAYLDLTEEVEKIYVDQYGADSQQVKDCMRGTQGEPKVNQLAFDRLIARGGNIVVKTQHVLHSARVQPDSGRFRIESAAFVDPMGVRLTVAAKQFIDGSYEGDLLARVGVPYRVGREGRDEYGESLAPEKPDGQLQAYNFRMVTTRDPKNRAAVWKPEGYRREDHLPLLELFASKQLKTVFCDSSGGVYKAHRPPMPNGKHDVNDVSRGVVRLSMPLLSPGWPDGDEETRRRIFADHVRHNVGMLYFLQNDEAVPENLRTEAREWGFCRDEFAETMHLPEQLYVREARRMVGRYVFTEKDTDAAENDCRSVFRAEAVAMGDYGPNCHGTFHEGPTIGGRHTGEFYKNVAPYQIPLGTLTPRECSNLLAPTACSASHVGFCALRLEPIWMSLGQAAGAAAHEAMAGDGSVQSVDPAKVQARLHAAGAATIYTSDVPRSSPDFLAVQWWGSRGGLHGVTPSLGKQGQRGANIASQYFQAFLGHAVELSAEMTPELKGRWRALAVKLELPVETLDRETTRGGWIRAAYAAQAKAGQAKAGDPAGERKSAEQEVRKNLEYASRNGRAMRLDLYQPKQIERPTPVVVWIHGGGWSKGSKDRCPATWLVEHGYSVASVEYRLTGEAQWPAQIDDCRDAVRWLRGNAETYQLDGRRIGVWGSSAGGHLAALVGTLDDAPGRKVGREVSARVQAVCDWYGPSDLLTMPPNVLSSGKTVEQLAKSNGALLLGGVVRDLPELAKQASALYSASKDDPPFLIMHGDEDPNVPLDQSERLHVRLKEVGGRSTLHVVQGAGHGGKKFQSQELRETIRKFFDAALKPAE